MKMSPKNKKKPLKKPKCWTFEVLGFFKPTNVEFFEAIFQPCFFPSDSGNYR